MDKKAAREGKGYSAAELADADVLEAMKSLASYIDITPGDFQELCRVAFRLAVERLMRSVTARDIMTRNVVSVSPTDTLERVVNAMSEGGVSGVPVIDPGGVVVGVISEKDVIRRMLGGAKIQAMGYSYVLLPVATGALIMLIVALVFNNLPKTRKYPEYWL